ncbi:MAG: hypothetical protein HY051_00860 [Candidatus Aenigmarchaeota archaeon]|nr:hypothetical protein [Candidatus Aenigmarchaeota archaeon]
MKNIIKYRINGQEFVTIEILNDKGQRVYVKSEPVNNQVGYRVANILDRPEDVSWSDKMSHFEHVYPIGNDPRKGNYSPCCTTGSFCVQGSFTIFKDPQAELIVFPINPITKDRPVQNFNISGNASAGSVVTGSVDSPAWMGYATTTGTISVICGS